MIEETRRGEVSKIKKVSKQGNDRDERNTKVDQVQGSIFTSSFDLADSGKSTDQMSEGKDEIDEG